MSKRYTFGKQERLKSQKQIERLFREGNCITVFPYRVLYLSVPIQTPAAPLQAGVTVSRRNFKKAVHRNRIKRLTREVFRMQRYELQQKLSSSGNGIILFFIYNGREIPQYLLVKEKMQVILNKLIAAVNENSV